jgi:hypothetical protein
MTSSLRCEAAKDLGEPENQLPTPLVVQDLSPRERLFPSRSVTDSRRGLGR